jgi:hypothetical protein
MYTLEGVAVVMQESAQQRPRTLALLQLANQLTLSQKAAENASKRGACRPSFRIRVQESRSG